MSTLHVEATGHGPPLVLLHGWAMHAGIWGPLVPRLARRHRVYAVDLPGHGRSAELPRFTLDAVVETLAARFADTAQPVSLLGWSLGGQLAIRWALSEPQRVGRVALVCTTPRFVAAADWPHAASEQTIARFGDELRVAWTMTVRRFLSLQMHGAEHARATLAALREELFARGEPSRRALAEALEAIVTNDLREAAGGVAQPALVVSGSRDTLAWPEAGRWLASRLPQGRFVPIDGAAHLPFLSHADRFDEAIEGFLDGR